MQKPKKSRIKLDEERIFKKQQGEGQEYLDVITQSDEQKAADAIIETQKEVEKQTLEDEFLKKEELKKKLRFTNPEYVKGLAETMNDMAQYIDLPKGYYYKVNFNEEKLNLKIHSPDGKVFGRGIVPVGDPNYDFHAIGILVTQAENTVDMIEERGAFRKDGLILPKGVK